MDDKKEKLFERAKEKIGGTGIGTNSTSDIGSTGNTSNSTIFTGFCDHCGHGIKSVSYTGQLSCPKCKGKVKV